MVAAGGAGQQAPTVSSPARGWVGEQPIDTRYDDWEPAIAADPNGPYVYAIVTRYAPKPCTGNGPSPWIAIERSSDGGATWTPGAPLCACKSSGQFDPIIEVVPDTGHESRGQGDVRVAWYETVGGDHDAWNVRYRRSRDGGATWSTAIRLSDAADGAGYKTAAGFAEVYGDYGEMAITSAGKAIAIWGEGYRWIGPGDAWFNRES